MATKLPDKPIRGDTLEIAVQFTEDPDHSLNGAKVYITIKKSISDADAAAVLKDTYTLGVGETSHVFSFGPPSYSQYKDTTKLELGKSYGGDIQIKYADGYVETIDAISFTVDDKKDYTQGAD